MKNFIPAIWHGQVFEEYKNKLVFGALTNKDYQGEITKLGDEVLINSIKYGTARDFTGASATYDDILDDQMRLKIDQTIYSGKQVNNISEAQTNPKLRNKIVEMMAYELAEKIELKAASLYAQAGFTTGSTGSPTAINSANIISVLEGMYTKMSENNVPKDNRKAVVPPWFVGKMMLAKINKDTNNSGVISNGYMGTFLGFDFYESNNVAKSGTTWYAPMFFRGEDTIAFADQFLSPEAIKDKDQPKVDYLSQWALYGMKVVRPSSLGVVYCAPAAEA
jgi:hypothetical protein